MNHGINQRKLNRTSSHRIALFRNMVVALLQHEMIITTLPKAKELRRVVEPLITKAKSIPSVGNKRFLFNKIRNRALVAKLFDILSVRYKDRPGGYTRILKYGFRNGDNAPMAYMELVDRNTSEGDNAVVDIKPNK